MLLDPRRPRFNLVQVASEESAGFRHCNVDTIHGCGYLGCQSHRLAVVLSVAPLSSVDLTVEVVGGAIKMSEREKKRWLGEGEKGEKGRKIIPSEKQGFVEHYITFNSPPFLLSPLLSNISD